MGWNTVEAIVHFKAVSNTILIIGHIDTFVRDLNRGHHRPILHLFANVVEKTADNLVHPSHGLHQDRSGVALICTHHLSAQSGSK